MHCNNCGSTHFEEDNGLFYCSFCQTQSKGFTQESAQDYVDIQNKIGHELSRKKTRVKRVIPQSTGVLWTTTEAFNLILFKQLNNIFEINSEITDYKEMHEITRIVWLSYLRKSCLAFTDDESDDKVVGRRLHPASRFRDIQILSNKVETALPPFKNGFTDIGFCHLFTLGSDRVIRTFQESEVKNAKDFVSELTEEENNSKFFDIFNDRYKDPRKRTKNISKTMKISKESQKLLNELLMKMNSPEESENFDNFDDFDDFDEQIIPIEDCEHTIREQDIEEINDLSQKDKEKDSITSFDLNGTNDVEEDYETKLMKNMSKTSEMFSKYIPLSYLKTSAYIQSNYFIDLMSLPKTLSILNIVFRSLRYDIYCFDLIRWANEGHIPYNNCISCFPDDWLFIANDFHTFTSFCAPSPKTISILSAKIANFIRINSFPRPDVQKLLKRFAKDLNLPKDIVLLIEDNFNIFDNFSKELDITSKKKRTLKKMPSFETYVLMAILLVLKRIFILNDSSEKHLSRSLGNDSNLFNWDHWERFTRLRLELIRSYYIPSYPGNLEDIRDANLIAEHFLSETEFLSSGIRKTPFRLYEFRTDVQQEFKELIDGKEDNSSQSLLNPSLYPLTNATNFSLNQINSSILNQKMSISFEDKLLIPWSCSHGNAFHRGYQFLNPDHQKWSQSFKLLIYLSCFLLNCRIESLKPVLKTMEKRYFGKN